MAGLGYFLSVAIAVDQLGNALLAGAPDETLSSRAYRCGYLPLKPKKRWAIAMRVIDALFFWQTDHCKAAYHSEKSRAHMPGEFFA